MRFGFGSWGDEASAVLAPALVVAAVVVAVQWRASDVAFCRKTFEGLVRGRQSVETRIAWERLQAVGVNVGETYSGLPSEAERAKYRREFIAHLAGAFRQTGVPAKAFVGWRKAGRVGETVVVAVDYPAKGRTLLLGLPASGRKQIEAIQWQE